MQYYPKATNVVNHGVAQDSEAIRSCYNLVEKMKAMQGQNSINLSALETRLVPDVVIPPNFKVPKFEKYKGLSCLDNHLKMFCRKMVSHVRDDKLMIRCVQDSLTGAPFDWYMQLDRSNIRTW